jgi:hypothetical protein
MGEIRDKEQAWSVLKWTGEINTDMMGKETEW